ncbi:uncharacterized protein LOC125224956 [Leguminivora glycinivorella]|uniref:uncharacterized protein LOC125224956 n=1 Tax=Leguminivora glycinivorella TaxID=1035111 RepID=UPI00200BF3D8|nr:uncharacterized protein LOC125224956 [Leguminivora glycinivorella]
MMVPYPLRKSVTTIRNSSLFAVLLSTAAASIPVQLLRLPIQAGPNIKPIHCTGSAKCIPISFDQDTPRQTSRTTKLTTTNSQTSTSTTRNGGSNNPPSTTRIIQQITVGRITRLLQTRIVQQIMVGPIILRQKQQKGRKLMENSRLSVEERPSVFL